MRFEPLACASGKDIKPLQVSTSAMLVYPGKQYLSLINFGVVMQCIAGSFGCTGGKDVETLQVSTSAQVCVDMTHKLFS